MSKKKKTKNNEPLKLSMQRSKEIMDTLNSLDTDSPEYAKLLKQLCADYIVIKDVSSEKLFREWGSKEKVPCHELFKTNSHYNDRRIDAAVSYIKHAADTFRPKYPSYSIEQIILLLLAGKTAYLPDSSFGKSIGMNIVLASAVYILDDLNKHDNITEAMLYIPTDDRAANVPIANFFEDTVYDTKLIKGLMYLIIHRNENEKTVFLNHSTVKRTKKNVPERKYHTSGLTELMDACEDDDYSEFDEMLTEIYNEAEEMNCRERLDKIFSLMSPDTVARAENNFKNDIDRFVEVVLNTSSDIWQRITEVTSSYNKIYDELDADYDAIKNQINKRRSHNRVQKTLPLSSSKLDSIVNNMDLQNSQPINAMTPGLSSVLSIDIPVGIEYKRYQNNLAKYELLLNEMDELSDKFSKTMIVSLNGLSLYERQKFLSEEDDADDADDANTDAFDDDELSDTDFAYLSDINNKIKRFSVRNPYETCFAYFELLDSGDDIVWLIEIALGVLRFALDTLPWYDIYPDGKLDDNDEQLKYDDTLDIDRTNAMLYSLKYNSFCANKIRNKPTDDDSLTQINLAQLLYHLTGVLPPRDLNDNGRRTKDDLIASGFNKQNADMVRLLVEYGKSVRKISTPFESETVDEDDEHENANDVLAAVKNSIDADAERNKAKALEKELFDTKQKMKDMQKKYEQMLEEANLEKMELIELREIVYRLQNDTEPVESEEENPVTLPYTCKSNIVIFGGHDSWSRAFRPLIKNVRMIDPYTNPDVNLIRNADVVWMQTNAMPHSFYNKIMDIARLRKIPVKYFATASASKCAIQLAEYDIAANSD